MRTATQPASACPHTTRDDDRLLRAYARTRDPELRRRLVERYLPLARYAAFRFPGTESFDDLQQVAAIGLLKAIDRFDPENGATFPAYAIPTMVGELRRHFRDRCWVIRPPRGVQENALKVERAIRELSAEHGISPTTDDVARRAGLSPEEVLEAGHALHGRHHRSLNAGAGDDERSELERRLGTLDEGFAQVEDDDALAALTAPLGRREREILRLRFVEDLSQAEIGAIVGLSQMHVSRLLRGAMDTLRRAAAEASATSSSELAA